MGGMALGAAVIGAAAASAAASRQNQYYHRAPAVRYYETDDEALVANAKTRRAKTGRSCVQTEWDAMEGYVRVRVPC
jgi:hypothetical protein